MADDLSIEQLRELLARKEQEQRQQELDRQARLDADNDPSRQLVPASPSPRKKRRTSLDVAPAAAASTTQKRPRTSAPPDFPASASASTSARASSGLGRSLNPSDRVELRQPSSSRTEYASHMSAVPKSVADRIAEAKAVDRAKQERKQRRASSSAAAAATGTSTSAPTSKASKAFPYAPTSANPFDALVKGRTESTRLSEKGRTVPIGSKEDKAGLKDLATKDASRESGPSMARGAKTPAYAATGTQATRPVPKPVPRDGPEDDLEITGGPQRRTRNKDGTLVEEVVMGPREFDASPEDPEWNRIEPYSGIQLKERILPHEEVDDLLVGRYHLTPSQIYSLARVDSRQRIDLDPEQVDADFVVIGVLAWKDEIRFLNSNAMGSARGSGAGGPAGKGKGKRDKDDDSDSDGDEEEGPEALKSKKPQGGRTRSAAGGGQSSQSQQQDPLFRAPNRRQRRQQYVRFSLVDLSTTSASSSATGQLSLMLVQADAEDKAVDEDGNEVSVYKGQSGGAYEKFWKESAGAVVAIINPSFLPYHKDFSYTLKPTSEASMVVIGRAENLAFCEATKADGNRCGKWVDARTGRTCQFHVELAIKRTGVRRPETMSNTASLAQKGTFNSSAFKKSLGSSSGGRPGGGMSGRKPLSPPPGIPSGAQVIAGSKTYVTSGARSNAKRGPNATGGGGPFSALTLPASRAGAGFIPGLREGASVSEEKKRLKRQAEDDKRARRELRELVGRDQGKTPGGEYLERARRGKENARAAKASSSRRKRGEGDSSSDDGGSQGGEDVNDEENEQKPAAQSVFKAEALRRIGFNPTAKPGDVQKDESSEAKQYRLALEDGMTNRSMKLSAPPGPKVRSGVKAPESRSIPIPAEAKADDDDDDDLVVEGMPADGSLKLPFPRRTKASDAGAQSE